MERDWDAEEQDLRAKALEAFEALMGIKSAAKNARSRNAVVYAVYLADDALDAYQEAKAKLASFAEARRANDK